MLPAAAANAAPKVAVSIQPVHSLVAGVMEGIGTPVLIVRSTGSAHSYSLKPSEARALREADAIFWVGADLETFLVKPLAALPKSARVVTLSTAKGMTLYPNRIGGPWDVHGEAHDHGNDAKPASPANRDAHESDMHIWLDVDNARRIVETAVETLSAVDSANAARYRDNGAKLFQRLAALDAGLKTRLKPVVGLPYIVFHDAYQYYETRYGLTASGAITVSPELKPSAKRLSAIRAKVTGSGARCIFREPQFNAAVIDAVAEGTTARTGQLDPLGATFTPGPEAYFQLMTGLADSFLACLGHAG
jgi:zinc transport system substrate-binding protein